MMQTETGENISSAKISPRHDRDTGAIHGPDELEFFLPEPFAKRNVLWRAIAREEILGWTPPLLIRLWYVLQTIITFSEQVIDECLRPLRFQRGNLPRLVLNEVRENLGGAF